MILRGENISVGILSLVLYIAVILFWNILLKRNIGEAMIVSLLAVIVLGGSQAFDLMYKSIVFAATQETLFAAMAFIYMASLMKETGLVLKMVDILNSVFGRIAGGAGYISTFASALFGMISGSGSGNAAYVGSITIPWMVNSGWSKNMSATIVAVGAVAFSALTHVGVPPVTAAACILIFNSTEGASPTSSAPIYIASGLAQVNPVVTFKLLIFLYVIPTILIGVLIGLGILPI